MVHDGTDPGDPKLLDKVGWKVGDVDLFEINEAFAVVAMAAQRDLGIRQRQTEHQWRRLCARTPDRRDRRPLIVTLLHALEAETSSAASAAAVHRRR